MATPTTLPEYYDGTDPRRAIFVAWQRSIVNLLERNPTPKRSQTRIASKFLAGNAREWYCDTYVNGPLPELPKFFDDITAKFCPETRKSRRPEVSHPTKPKRQLTLKVFRLDKISTASMKHSPCGERYVGPVLLDAEDDSWQVNELLDHRCIGGHREYLVWFTGCEKLDAMWIHENDVAEDLVIEYHSKVSLEEEIRRQRKYISS
jgi:hypothetical protein